jgi:hypothetical protein
VIWEKHTENAYFLKILMIITAETVTLFTLLKVGRFKEGIATYL